MSDASSDEEERKIRSGKTKRLEALEKVIDNARKHANIQDFEKLQEDFDNWCRRLKINRRHFMRNMKTIFLKEYSIF